MNTIRFFQHCRSMVATAIVAGLIAPAFAEDTQAFGVSAPSEAAMMGIFYDLKQTQDHRATPVTPENYWAVVDEFLASNWDESILNRYYRTSKALYTTQIYIKDMNADLAPKAFGVDKMVQPSRWIIHYKAQVSPPETGIYRFVGGSDDIIAVAVNRKTVLVSPLKLPPEKIFPRTNWHTAEPIQGSLWSMCNGDWIEMNQSKIFDLDIIIGERPGGSFNAYLMIQKQGQNYAQDPWHNLTLPVFQLAPYNTMPPERVELAPPFVKEAPTWKSYQ